MLIKNNSLIICGKNLKRYQLLKVKLGKLSKILKVIPKLSQNFFLEKVLNLF